MKRRFKMKILAYTVGFYCKPLAWETSFERKRKKTTRTRTKWGTVVKTYH